MAVFGCSRHFDLSWNGVDTLRNERDKEVMAQSEVFVVLDGTKVGGIYHWREDADAHAQAVGGTVMRQAVKTEVPGWVQVMLEKSKGLAKMQGAR